jgi:periplasmic divalent cation tolerance protein
MSQGSKPAQNFRRRGGFMTDNVVIMVTSRSRRECRKIARRLIEEKLAACVNITQGIQSVYRWEGKVTQGKEFLLFIKSTRALFPEIRAEISLIHSYHTPEIICLPIIDGSRNYLQWMGDSVRKPAEPKAVDS